MRKDKESKAGGGTSRRGLDDQSWIQASSSVGSAAQQWTPQKQRLAKEIQDLRVFNKDQSKELVRALEKTKRLEE